MATFKVTIKGRGIFMVNATTKKEAVMKVIQLLEGKKMMKRDILKPGTLNKSRRILKG